MNPLAGNNEGAKALLPQLAAMQQLTHLDVGDTLEMEEDGDVSAFSALIASSRLQELHVRERKLPEGVWEHIFPAGRVLPVLRHLTCGVRMAPSSTRLASSEVERLVHCCPALQRLSFAVEVYGVELGPLSQLTQLQHLWAEGTTKKELTNMLGGLSSLTQIFVN